MESLGAGQALHDEVAMQTVSPRALAAAYDSLSGELHASALGALAEDSQLLRDAAMARFRDEDRAAATTLARGEGVTAWVSGYGNKGGTDGDSGTAHRDRDTHGALLGVDRVFADGGRAGMLVGYGRTNLALAEQRDVQPVVFISYLPAIARPLLPVKIYIIAWIVEKPILLMHAVNADAKRPFLGRRSVQHKLAFLALRLCRVA